MKIYMAGVGGMLGEAFYDEFKTLNNIKCTDLNLTEEWLGHLDFRDSKSAPFIGFLYSKNKNSSIADSRLITSEFLQLKRIS